MIRLYRAVSPEELADIADQGGFRAGSNSLAGKWFAETAEAAKRWGEFLYPSPSEAFHVIQVEIPRHVADQMFRLGQLDQIGPARYAEGDVLELVNQNHQGISSVPVIAGGP
ncbi:MAG: hypothetical protein HYX68_03465 [Planctomycetes bacterium]|nr:hypothetical protein [Planctomycetota bacterium]